MARPRKWTYRTHVLERFLAANVGRKAEDLEFDWSAIDEGVLTIRERRP